MKLLSSFDNSPWIKGAFYVACTGFVALACVYGIMKFKSHLLVDKINSLDLQIAAYASPQQKAYQAKVLEYKKKIDDYDSVLADHHITSHVFSFMEDKALPNVWFSAFTMAEGTGTIILTGEAPDMETASRQMHEFEKSSDYISGITSFDSHAQLKGATESIAFNCSLAIKPEIFNYPLPASHAKPSPEAEKITSSMP